MTTSAITYSPAADIFEQDAAYLIQLDMPGVSQSDVEVEIERQQLRVSGGHYERYFNLGQGVQRDGVTAQVDNGVLSLRLPKSPETQPRRIPVGTSDSHPD